MYNTRTGPGHGRVLSVRCCAAAYCLPGQNVQSEFILELVSHILRGCACGTVYDMGRSMYLVRLCKYVCMYGGEHVQPERCIYRREYVYARVYGVPHVRTEWCTCHAEVQVRVFSQYSTCAI